VERKSCLIIKNLEFSYPEATEKNLKNISLNVKKGEKIGLVGSSGSGKSTITKLISGLYKPDNGQINLTFKTGEEDQTNSLFDLDSTEWHDRQFMVSQDSEMFSANIRDNITLFDNSISPEKLEKAIKIAQLDELITNLPQGLETLIGEKGYKLSGGQRQRVGIARALVHNYELICLDEATSALDSQTENNFQTALESNWQNQTLIIVAHRFSTLRNVDRIYVFENGEIIENGSFEELVTKNGKFAELWELQQKQIEV
jgi:ATP-binding cassette, subfamily B, bacterial